MFKSSEKGTSAGLIIHSRLAFGSLVVMVEGFYSGKVRIDGDVNTLRAYRLLPLPILGNCGCFASKATVSCFEGPEEFTGKRRSRSASERRWCKKKKPGGHHVHGDG